MKGFLIAGAAFALCLAFSATAPARPAEAAVPQMETLKGEKPIELQSLRISARLRGGMAETTVRMTFFNPNARQLEGNLQFPLLDGQQVTGFALDFDGKLRAAVPVEKSRGRQVFEAVVRRNVDPALLEKTQGNNFRLRVYPIAARGVRIVEVRYAEALARQDGQRRYRLPLGYGESLRDFSLEVDSDAPSPPVANGVLGALVFERRGGLFQATVARPQFGATGELEVVLPTPAEPQASVEAREDGVYFVAEVPVDVRPTARRLPKRVGLLWDSSMNGAKRAHASELALLDHYFRALGDGDVRLVRLRDRPEPAQDFRIRGGNWAELRRALESTRYDGASALADWTPEAGVGEYLLVSDGLLNYGPLAFRKLLPGVRLYAISSAQSSDRDRLRAVAEASGGRLVDLTPGHSEDGLEALLNDGARIASLSGESLADLEAAPGGGRDGFLRVAGRLLAPRAILSIERGDGRQTRLEIRADAPASPLAAREWASYRLARLSAQPELSRGEIARLGTRFGIATSETSLIVLDRVEDYVRHNIAPPQELAQAYAVLHAKREAETTKDRAARLEEVIEAFTKKVAWWEREHPKGPPPKQLPALTGGSTGSIVGTARAGTTVLIENPATGFRREITVRDDRGIYRVGQLPVGTYRVTENGRTREVTVAVGGSATAESLRSVTVTGSAINAIDVDSVESTTVLTDGQIAAMPVPRDITSVALLAPGTVTGRRSQRVAAAVEPPQPRIGIAVKPWQADAPYMARLKAATPEHVYPIYLDLRPTHATSVGFYLDVGEVLLERDQKALALRVLSNLAEMDLDNRQVLRVLGYRLLQAGEPALAIPVFQAVLRIADYEPQSFRDLGNAYAAAGRKQEALNALAEVVSRTWDDRFAEIELISLAELNAIIATAGHPLDTRALDSRLQRNLPLDLRVVLTWDADNSDLDLWVTDPNDEKAYYSHKLTYQGGRMSDDFTGGYGPEEFSLRVAKKGRYKVEVHYYGDRQQSVAGPTSLQLRFTTKFGTAAAEDKLVSLRLKDGSNSVLVGEFEVD